MERVLYLPTSPRQETRGGPDLSTTTHPLTCVHTVDVRSLVKSLGPTPNLSLLARGLKGGPPRP